MDNFDMVPLMTYWTPTKTSHACEWDNVLEAWHTIQDKKIIPIEKVDEALLRELLSAHSKTPLKAMHIETNSLPIRYILKSRRLMYLHTILQREPTEMIQKIYKAQKADPSPGDFCELVTDDFTELGLDIGEGDFAWMNKQKCHTIVKAKVRSAD